MARYEVAQSQHPNMCCRCVIIAHIQSWL